MDILGAKVARYEYKSDSSCDVIARSSSDEAISSGSPRSPSTSSDSLAMTGSGCSKRLGLIAEEAPKEILSVDGKGVDLYKMASLAWAGMKALSSSVSKQQEQIDKLKIDVEELRLLMANAPAFAEATAGRQIPMTNSGGFSFVSVLSGLRYLGAAIENGVARFQSVIAKSFTVEKPVDQNQATIGEGIITAGETEYQIVSDKIEANSKIFVTFRGDYGSRWWIDRQAEGEAVVKISQPLAQDVRFDWWVVGAPEPTENPNDPSSAEASEGGQTSITNDQNQQVQPPEVTSAPASEIAPEPVSTSAPEAQPPVPEATTTTAVQTQ